MRSLTTDKTESVDSMYSSMRSPFASSQAESEIKLKHCEAMRFTKEGNLHFLTSFSPIQKITQTFSEITTMSQSKLMALCTEMEQLIMQNNADLVSELAHRDELEYEKEVKNTFITLLVSIQDQRRKFLNEKKRKNSKPLDPANLPQVSEYFLFHYFNFSSPLPPFRLMITTGRPNYQH